MGSQRVRHDWATKLNWTELNWTECYGWGLPRWLSGKESTCPCRRCKRCGLDRWVRKIPWRRAWQPTPEFLPGESPGQRSLAGYSPWACKESGMTEWLSTHTKLWLVWSIQTTKTFSGSTIRLRCFLIICVFTGAVLSISFKNFFFAVTAWLLVQEV